MIRLFKKKPFLLIQLVSVFATLPSVAACFFILPNTHYDRLEVLTILVLVLSSTAMILYGLYLLILRPWQGVANIIRACIENDFSQRMIHMTPTDPIGLVGYELNELANLLQTSRFNFIETRALLLKVLDSVDVCVFLFDHRQRLVMSNRAAASLYRVSPADILGKTVSALELNFAFMALPNTSHEHRFPAKKSKWLIKRSSYREAGFSHSMGFLDDIRSSLREEELTAWKRLIRVLSHEINNSMTPMRATVGGLQRMLRNDLDDAEWRDNFEEGLSIIERRVENLNSHVRSYSQIASQPRPRKNWFSLSSLLSRITEVYENDLIVLQYEDDLCFFADESQFEQVLTNLINNAKEASVDGRENNVTLSWEINDNTAYIKVTDNGCGIDNFDNVFIPYFTTKEKGSGVGLFISQQIIEAHDGFLQIENVKNGTGCLVTIVLPV